MAEPKKNVEKEEKKESKFDLLTDEQKARAAELLEAEEEEAEEDEPKEQKRKISFGKKAKIAAAVVGGVVLGGLGFAAGDKHGKKSASSKTETAPESSTTEG